MRINKRKCFYSAIRRENKHKERWPYVVGRPDAVDYVYGWTMAADQEKENRIKDENQQ